MTLLDPGRIRGVDAKLEFFQQGERAHGRGLARCGEVEFRE